jgi:hypothetical protein
MNFMALLTNSGAVVGWVTSDSLWMLRKHLCFCPFSQVRLVGFPAGAPACVPAPQPCHKRLRIGFSFLPHRAGLAGESLFIGLGRFVIHLILLICSSFLFYTYNKTDEQIIPPPREEFYSWSSGQLIFGKKAYYLLKDHIGNRIFRIGCLRLKGGNCLANRYISVPVYTNESARISSECGIRTHRGN